MNNWNKLLGWALALSLCLIAIPGFASTVWTNLNSAIAKSTLSDANVQPLDQGTAQVGLTVNRDDITPDQDPNKLVLTSEQTHQAQVWSLTPDEEKRYVFLMQNRAALQYQGRNLSPVWILGLNARTDTERAYYARLAATQEEQFIAQNLAWRTAFEQAYADLMQGLPIIKPFDVQKFSPYNAQQTQYQMGDSLDLFVSPSDPVRGAMASLLTALTTQPTLTLNIYMVGTTVTADTIQTWAKEQSVPVTMVQAKRITLNAGNKQYAALKNNQKTPLLLLIRNGQALPVDIGQL